MNGFFNEKMEKISREELRRLQLKRLKKVVRNVYDNVPWYHRKFKEFNVKPDDIRSLSDIKKLPFTTKNDLRENAPFGMLAVPLYRCIELHASSGTTGTPVTVCYTRNDIEVW